MGNRLLWIILFACFVCSSTFGCQDPTSQEPAPQEKTTEPTGDASVAEPATETTLPEKQAEQTTQPEESTSPETTAETIAETTVEQTPEGPPAGAWQINVQPGTKIGFASKSLLGHYELSGEMFQMDQRNGLIDKMKKIGFSDWRMSVARWEVSTWLLPSLTDGTSCASILTPFPPEALAPSGASDTELMKQRDWFTYTDGTKVTTTMTQDDARYQLTYLRKQLDIAAAFGATPFVSLDHMPRALSAEKTIIRKAGNNYEDPCLKTFTNAISNSRPADNSVYGAALAGLVKRIVEGSDGQTARAVTHWEVGNEPEFAEFWDRSYLIAQGLSGSDLDNKAIDSFFGMALGALIQLDAYRSASQHTNAKALKFGLASFAQHDIAITVLNAFDSTKLPSGKYTPMDFISFHAYDNDPLAIVNKIKQVAASRAASTHYKQIELVLAEWGPTLDGKGWDAATMDLPLLMTTVVALGALQGLDRAHHSIFWDFYSQGRIRFGLLDYDVQPKPLYHAYALLYEWIGAGRDIVSIEGTTEGQLEGGLGVALATKDAQGKTRLLLINRDTKEHTFVLKVDDKEVIPTEVNLFDKPATPPQIVANSAILTLPPKSIMTVLLP